MSKNPFPAEDAAPLQIDAQTVFAVVKAIIGMGKEDEFVAACNKAKATIAVEAAVVTLVKKYMIKTKIHTFSLEARAAVESERCTPPRQ
ncbi:hypothetical protein [Methylorubrum extorquens]